MQGHIYYQASAINKITKDSVHVVNRIYKTRTTVPTLVAQTLDTCLSCSSWAPLIASQRFLIASYTDSNMWLTKPFTFPLGASILLSTNSVISVSSSPCCISPTFIFCLRVRISLMSANIKACSVNTCSCKSVACLTSVSVPYLSHPSVSWVIRVHNCSMYLMSNGILASKV